MYIYVYGYRYSIAIVQSSNSKCPIRGNRVSPKTLSGYSEPCAVVTHMATFAINNPVMIGTKSQDAMWNTVGSTFNK